MYVARILSFFIVLVVLPINFVAADVLNDVVFYDDSDGLNFGGNVTALSFDYLGSLTSAEGISFDYTIQLTAMDAAGNAANVRTNGGTGNREFGVRMTGASDNAALETGEKITASLQAVTITDFNGFDPGNVTVNFDGFTSAILFFTGNDGDAGEITDGSGNSLFSFVGALNDSPFTTGAPFTFGVTGQSGNPSNSSNAQVDLSSLLPDQLNIAGITPAAGAVDPNRFRVDDFGVQFTVTAIPEPGFGVILLGLIGSTLGRRRR